MISVSVVGCGELFFFFFFVVIQIDPN